MKEIFEKSSFKYLQLLGEKFPTLEKACIEIINLQAILELPKGTEHFISDIHGEFDAFNHLLNSCSGVIKEKVDAVLQNCTNEEKSELEMLIYYPEDKLSKLKGARDLNSRYSDILHKLIEVCRLTVSKYTRSKVRKAMSKNYGYILDELLNSHFDSRNKEEYYGKIISTVIALNQAETLITEFCRLIKRLAVDRLHIVGDIYDRGRNPDLVIDDLISHHSVDIQWGNHDIVWMAAASGSVPCILTVLFNSLRHNNMQLLEIGYGISMRELSDFASTAYFCGLPAEKCQEKNQSYSKILKAVAVMLFKSEGAVIKRHPEFEMDDRILLLKTDFTEGVTVLDGEKYALIDCDFPTVNGENPLKFSVEEQKITDNLRQAFLRSERLQRHMEFLYAKGSLYRCVNNNLLFHGCIPTSENGEFDSLQLQGQYYSGKALYDMADKIILKGRYFESGEEKDNCLDEMWYLWCGKKSPLFGREKMTSFERLFLRDAPVKEPQNPYYVYAEGEEFCKKVLAEFNICHPFAHIVNGHIPVKARLGESPVRANGKRLVIDGGLCRSYHETTGNAGYTLIFNSYGLKVAIHSPFEGKESALQSNKDNVTELKFFEQSKDRIKVRETDNGKNLEEQISNLMQLCEAYKKGMLKERE